MPDEQTEKPNGPTKIARIVNATQWFLLQPTVAMSLLLVAMIEALLSLFLGWHFAVASIGTAAVAIGLILAHGALGIQCLGSWAAGIYEQLLSLHDEEVKKLTEPQRRAAPPAPPSWWKN
jgi:hypothetical protein